MTCNLDPATGLRSLWVAGVLGALFLASAAPAQVGDPSAIHFRVQGPSQRLEMVANSSRILTLDKEIPRALVNNTEIVRLIPISPTQVQVSALRPGVTQVNLWDEDGAVHTVDVVIFGDARELELLLKSEFPHSALRVRPLASSVVLSGYVDRPEAVSRIVRMAEDYYPKVINNITVGGVQQVMLHVKVMEVSRTKLRAMGFDFAVFSGNDFVIQDVSQLLGEFSSTAQSVVGTGAATVTFGILDGANAFFGFLEALREYNLVKVLAEPTLVTVSGRPASFLAGGEFPILVPQSLGSVSIEYKQFGTRVDFVPIVLGNGNVRLEVRPQISEIDSARGVTINAERIPGLRTRWVDTAVEMRAGQTLALAGLIQTRTEAQNRGIPWLADLPWAGAAFRKVEETTNEVELLVTVRPELVDALDPHQVPPCGPGETFDSPRDVDLYFRGYLEVPKCCPDGSCGSCRQAGVVPGDQTYPAYPGPLDPNAVQVPAQTSAAPVLESARRPAQARSVLRDRSATADYPASIVPPDGVGSGGYQPPIRHSGNHTAAVAPEPSRYSPQHVGGRSQPRQVSHAAAGDDPGLVGPLGYDMIDYKR